jgi:hypothetical protein
MMRNLVTSLLEHERLETTQAKAKELRQLAEKIITLAKKNDLHARRQALAVVRSKDVVAKLFSAICGNGSRIARAATAALSPRAGAWATPPPSPSSSYWDGPKNQEGQKGQGCGLASQGHRRPPRRGG